MRKANLETGLPFLLYGKVRAIHVFGDDQLHSLAYLK